jgi:hypothetical protein
MLAALAGRSWRLSEIQDAPDSRAGASRVDRRRAKEMLSFSEKRHAAHMGKHVERHSEVKKISMKFALRASRACCLYFKIF